MHYTNDTHFKGIWENDMRKRGTHVFGKNVYSAVVGFPDNFNNDKMEGYGKLNWDNESAIYEGEMKDNKRHGSGKMVYRNGSTFTGDWLDNKRAQGTMTYPGKGTFVGNFATNTGKYTWLSGDSYEGKWLAGKRHGEGKMVWAKLANKYEGQFADNKRQGEGKFTYADGSHYTGNWSNNEKEG